MTAELSEPATTESWGAERERTFRWHDPVPSTAVGLALAGVDYLKPMVDGTLPPPPIFGLMRFELTEVELGRVVFTCQLDESAYNPIGTVHGGLV